MPINISSNLSTKSTSDRYATHLGNLTKGGLHTKNSIAERNNIPFERRERMMICSVADTGNGVSRLYWLLTPPNPTDSQLSDNSFWEEITFNNQNNNDSDIENIDGGNFTEIYTITQTINGGQF